MVLVLIAGLACSKEKTPSIQPYPLGYGCEQNRQCASGMCLDRPSTYAFCTAPVSCCWF